MGAVGPRSVFLATLVCVALAACGGSSSPKTASSSSMSSAPATTGITKDAYIQQANSICAVMNSQVKAASSTSLDLRVQAASVDDVSAITRTALRSLRDLPTPSGDADVLARSYADVDRTLSDADRLVVALRAGELPQARRISKTLAQHARAANDAANAYGLTVCGATT